ncbi:hypothetical protein [Desulfovermiculus halophilus]|jgi:hypothetical protein|uniref:hypothetical protein n=1 Tax=Desulfovermiculus halophilus TaxID=339722 RepID=UPI001FC9C0C0|nr:hypothetical protein [Desulfovermiculus halophilus]
MHPRPASSSKGLVVFVALRDLILFIAGVWYFEFHVGYTFPDENNLLLYFVAIPIIWATLIQIWTTTTYKEQKNTAMSVFTHLVAVLILISTIFLISATLKTIQPSLDPLGNVLFHFVGWTVIVCLIYYDLVDICRLSL